MSAQVRAIEERLLEIGRSAIQGLVTSIGDLNLDDVTATEYPRGFTPTALVNPEALEFDQETREIEVAVVCAFQTVSSEELRDQAEVYRDLILADPTLSGLVQRTQVAIAFEEFPKLSRKTFTLVVSTETDTGSDTAAAPLGPGPGVGGAIHTAVENALAATSGGRMPDDYQTSGVPPGESRWQQRIDGVIVNERSSNDTWLEATVSVLVHTNLSGFADPRSYTEATKIDQQEALLDPNLWRQLSGVREIATEDGARQGPEGEEAEREGDILTWTVAVRLRLE